VKALLRLIEGSGISRAEFVLGQGVDPALFGTQDSDLRFLFQENLLDLRNMQILDYFAQLELHRVPPGSSSFFELVALGEQRFFVRGSETSRSACYRQSKDSHSLFVAALQFSFQLAQQQRAATRRARQMVGSIDGKNVPVAAPPKK
jgi:hypothetical protein